MSSGDIRLPKGALNSRDRHDRQKWAALVRAARISGLIRTLIAVHQRPFISRRILLVAGVFSLTLLALQAWRSWVLLASYDQGIFQQVLWNSLDGHWFESTLSSQLSTNVIHDGAAPSVGYARLGQHFTPCLLYTSPSPRDRSLSRMPSSA